MGSEVLGWETTGSCCSGVCQVKSVTRGVITRMYECYGNLPGCVGVCSLLLYSETEGNVPAEFGCTCCESPCNADKCESCIDCVCEVCNDDPNQNCCYGSCYELMHCLDCNDTTKKTESRCKSELCEDCNTTIGYCRACGSDPHKSCCYGTCCDHTQCQDCNATTHACEVCGGDTTKTCINGHCCCAPNGCGPCDGPSVPNNPAGCSDTSFLDACNAHDECYGTCGNDKDICDSTFLGDATVDPPTGMLGICAGSSCGLPCFEAARAYYGAVHLEGQGAFDASQACSCG